MRALIRRAAAAIFLLVAVSAAARPFTARDLAMLDRVSAPRLSPDGRLLAYNLRTTDWAGNRGLNALHVVSASGEGEPVVLTRDEAAPGSARWSADGRWLYFLSSRSGTRQLWRASADGSERRQMTALPLDIGAFQVSRDGRVAAISIEVHADCPTLACSKARDEEAGRGRATGVHVRGGQGRFWDFYGDEKYVGLFSVRLDGEGAPAEAVALTRDFRADVPERPSGDEASFAFSRDGRTIWFASRDPAIEQGGLAVSSLYSVPADGSAAPRGLVGGEGSIARPALSPDGRTLAYLESTSAGWIYSRTRVMMIDLRTDRIREVAPDFDASLTRIAWSPDGRSLLAAGEERGQAPLYAIEVASGRRTRLTQDGQVSDFDSAPGVTAYLRESLTSPQQIWVRHGAGEPRQITRIGAALLAEAPLGDTEQFTFPGWNNETVHGWVVRPAGHEPGRRYPVAFLIHGGPHGSFGNAWSYRWNPQVWAGMGYAVVSVDFHGSSGYGEAFGRSIVGHWGDRPLEDLQKGWAAALARYDWLDGSRACALGGSYGGYMTAWIAGRWNEPWDCLVNHAGVFDTRFMAWSADIPAFTEAQYGGWQRPEDIERFNPSAHIGDWRVPMLVIHGARDYRVPLDQGIAAHNAARRAGVPTELLVFPDENHWVLKPQNSVQWYDVVERWMDRWTGARPSH
ncbi:MAG TPA: S9 family peptidase [Allosphingosinicella sp.]|nr:S9 family peptidase [Allosphingosinicella sp.]